MARLENVSVGELEGALEDATAKKETLRLVVAIIYKRGPSVPMIAGWLDLREATVYRWFDRLETEPVREAVQDRQRPGRPPKLADSYRERFREALKNPPTDAGYDDAEWTPGLAQQFLEDQFGVAYSRRHVQRLLNEMNGT